MNTNLQFCLCNILFLLVISLPSSTWKGLSIDMWSINLYPWGCPKLGWQNNQGHLRLFGKCLPESKELILKCIMLEYDTSEIMSFKRLRELSQFVHLKVKLLSLGFLQNESFNSFYHTCFGRYNNYFHNISC